MKEDDEEADSKDKAVIIYMDFAGLHEPQCKGEDAPDTEHSDFEKWSPYDGRHGNNKCWLGQ